MMHGAQNYSKNKSDMFFMDHGVFTTNNIIIINNNYNHYKTTTTTSHNNTKIISLAQTADNINGEAFLRIK